MPYLPSVALVVVGLVILGFLLVRLLREVRRTRTVLGVVRARFEAESGLVRARSAAVRVALERRRSGRGSGPDRVDSTLQGETGGRP